MAKRKSLNDVWVLLLVLVCMTLIGAELLVNVQNEWTARNNPTQIIQPNAPDDGQRRHQNRSSW